MPSSTDSFLATFGRTRGHGHTRPDIGSELHLTAGCARPLVLRLDDDAPLGDDPGGLHVTVWQPTARGVRYLVRRLPAAQALDTLSHPAKSRSERRWGLDPAGCRDAASWLERALGRSGVAASHAGAGAYPA